MTIYQLKITLNRISPPIWRRIQVTGDTKLGKLHDILQIVMGWEDDHLHQFVTGNASYGIPDPDFPDNLRSERNVRLDKIAGQGDSLSYEYDFGDGWEHTIKVEKVLAPEKDRHYPVCLDGKRACPPEDCGGPWGYQHLLEVLTNPQDEEHEEMLEWCGEDFDPEAFALVEINKMLRRLC